MDKKYSYDHKTDDQYETKIEVKIENSLFDEEKAKVYNNLAKKVKLKGFRAGAAPKNMIEAHIGPALFEETLNKILPQITYEIIAELKLEPITRVDYNVKKVGGEEGVEYEATFTVYPEVKLGKFDKVKVKKDELKVSDEEIDNVLKNMYEDSQKEKGEPKTEESDSEKKEDKKEKKEVKMDDAWVETLGMDNLKKMDDLKAEIKKTLEVQKERQLDEKYTADILKGAVEASEVKIPTKLIDVELEVREKNYKERIEKLGLNVDDFLRNQKTSIEDLKKDWAKEVEEKLQVDLLLTQIIRENKFKINKEDVEKEILAIQDEKLRKQYESQRGRMQIESIMLRQEAFKWLRETMEGTKK